MGQNSSIPKQRRRISLRSPFLRKKKSSSHSSLSHTFTYFEDDQIPESININFASEEELMTLPGVTRLIAHNIVQHRKVIGRFKKVEDLALVHGIGADKLEKIRPEICVFSNSPSSDSLKITDSNRNQCKIVNVNTANVFELQCVHGLTQEMAAAIVHHRNKKGPFKQLDDLRKVKYLDEIRLSNVRQHLSTTENENCERLNNVHLNGFLKNGISKDTKKSTAGPLRLDGSNGLSPSTIHDIHELLSAHSSRPIIKDYFRYERGGKAAFRVATWNLHQLSLEKIGNLGVKEVICRTILENKWSIIAVQDVLEPKALRVICEELNAPTLNKISMMKDNSRNWNFCILNSHIGFLYDVQSGGLETQLISLQEATVNKAEAIICEFTVSDLKLTLLNVHLPQQVTFQLLEEKFQELIDQNDCLLVFGDFCRVETKEKTEIGGLRSLVPLNFNTGCTQVKEKCRDNILLTKETQSKLSGRWGVVREGLTHLTIPNGWSWGGLATPHCPVWVELLTVSNQNGIVL